MSELFVTHTANAGFILTSGGKSILIDALHDTKLEGFSTLSPRLVESVFEILRESPPIAMLLTHRHPDHYSPALTGRVLRRWPECELLAPEDFDANDSRCSRADFALRAVKARHDGESFADVENMCYRLSFGGFEILAPGDASPRGTERLSRLISAEPIDLALLNFPWVTLSAPRRFVQSVVRPRCAVIAHLPFAGDDVCAFRAAAEQGAALLSVPRVEIMAEPLARLRLEKP